MTRTLKIFFLSLNWKESESQKIAKPMSICDRRKGVIVSNKLFVVQLQPENNDIKHLLKNVYNGSG